MKTWQAWDKGALGPAVVVLATLGYEYFRERGWPASTVILLPLLVLAGFLGGSPRRPWEGLWAGLLSAVWISGYSWYLGSGLERQVLVPTGVFVMALLVGFLRLWAWRGEQLEREAGELALDTNMARLESLEQLARELNQDWDRLSEVERRERVHGIWDRANNIQTLAEGWRQVGRHQYWARKG